MSGEPLSEELSPELESKLQETWNRVLVWKQCSPSEPSLKAILRAFAREILQPLDKDYGELAATYRASQESCRSLQKERDELAELIECDPGDSGTPCGNCRGCARSECRSLSEALENMLKDVEQPEAVGYERAALKVLRAYRSSEAGRGTE